VRVIDLIELHDSIAEGWPRSERQDRDRVRFQVGREGTRIRVELVGAPTDVESLPPEWAPEV
jgi:hypothetical protein